MRVNGVRKTYKIKDTQSVKALDGVSFDLPQAGMIFILGKSGSGKSTLLNVLSGLDKVDEGSIEVCGKDITKLTEKELSNYRNTCCGFIFQEYNLIPELSVSENIALTLQLQGEKNVDDKVQKVLQKVGLSGYEKRKVTELSGGQRQRIAVARAIIKNPEIIFADEPTGALDEQTGESILDLLRELSKDTLVIVVSHDREFAERYGDRIIELADGKIINDNASVEIKQESGTEWKKPKLPVKTALKIGCSNFKYHPIRLIATILLSVIAFTFLGISLNIALNNPTNNYIKALYKNNIEYTALYKYNTYTPDNEYDMSLDRFLGAKDIYKEKAEITNADIERFKDVYSGRTSLVLAADIYSFQKSIVATMAQLNQVIPTSDKCYAVSADGYISLNSVTCSELGFSIVGELPKNESEIAINECMLNTFMLAGISEEGNIFPIKTDTDIIGHKISINHNSLTDVFKTITGVVYTGCSKKCSATHIPENYHDKVIVCDDYFPTYTYALCEINSNHKNFVKAVINYNSNNTVFGFADVLSDGYYSSSLEATILKMLCLYLSIIFLIFAIVLLINFIAVSIRGQMKQIGILSSIGADYKQLIKIYYGSAMGLCGVIYILSLTLVGILTKVVNKYLINQFDALFNLR